jgi:hypothetical protein
MYSAEQAFAHLLALYKVRKAYDASFTKEAA